MSEERPSFPDCWGEPDCPPGDAVDADGVYYRCLKDFQITQASFLSYIEEGKERPRRKDRCGYCSLSVMGTLEDAQHLREAFPATYEGKPIGRCRLLPPHGKTKPSPTRFPSHTEWWSYSGVDRSQLFAIVEEV